MQPLILNNIILNQAASWLLDVRSSFVKGAVAILLMGFAFTFYGFECVLYRTVNFLKRVF